MKKFLNFLPIISFSVISLEIPSTYSTNLSAGQITGIIIGTLAAATLIAAIIYYILTKPERKNKKRKIEKDADEILKK